MSNFNGFRDLFKQSDLVNALLDKYYGLTIDIETVRSLESIERGRFSLHHFAFEMILAQDAVLDNMSAEQEMELFFLSLEHKDIKSDYPDIFGGVHNLPSALLYAKKAVRDNAAAVTLLNFRDLSRLLRLETLTGMWLSILMIILT